MRHSQHIPAGREKEESVHSFPISFRGLDRALGVVLDFDLRIGHQRIARIGYDAAQPTRGRCLSVQFVGEGERQK